MRYEQENMPLCDADDDKTLFGILFTIVDVLNSKRVSEHRLSQFEANIMPPQVGLALAPFQFRDQNKMEANHAPAGSL
jgi:hypothetical protein